MTKVLSDLMLEGIYNDLQETLLDVIEKSIKQSENLNEELAPLMGSIADMIGQAEARLSAAKRGLGLSNKLKTPEDRKRNRSRILANLNKLRNDLAILTKSLENPEGEHDPNFGNEILRRSTTTAI